MSTIRLAALIHLVFGMAGLAYGGPTWNNLPTAGVAAPGATAAPIKMGEVLLAQEDWERVPGCAKSIAAGGVNQIAVVGCGGALAADNIYFWRAQGAGGRFEPEAGGDQMFKWVWTKVGLQQSALPAVASWLAFNARGHLYGIGSDALVYRSAESFTRGNSSSWWRFSSQAGGEGDIQMTAIAVGGSLDHDNVWAISGEPNGPGGNKIYYAESCPKQNDLSPGKCWREAGGAARKVAVGNKVWVVSVDGGIYRRDGKIWTPMPGCGRDIAARGDHVYVVGCDDRGESRIFKWSGRSWLDTHRVGKTLALDVAGNPWVVTGAGEIWRRKPVVPDAIR
jgi:hypothetical protein